MMKLKNNNGFTLVELVISMIIMTIVMGLTMTMMISVGNMYSSSSNQNIDKEIGDGVFEIIETNLKYASALEIADSSSSCKQGYDKAISVDSDGHILYKGGAGSSAVSLYNNGFYNGRKIVYKLEKVKVKNDYGVEEDSFKHIKLTVKVLDKNNEPIYIRTNTVKCINLTLSSKANIVINANLSNTNRYISFDCDKLVYEENNVSFNLYNRLVYVKDTYNSINDDLSNGFINPSTARERINELFGTFNPKTKYGDPNSSYAKFNGVYATSEEVLYGVIKKYYNNGTRYYPSFDKPTSFFNGTYFGNNNKDMAIVAYFHMSAPTSVNGNIKGSHIEDFVIYSVERNQLEPLTFDDTANVTIKTHRDTYKVAQIVFNSGKNTWFYQPANANAVTDFFTMIGWYQNSPKTYDITNKTSPVVNNDIDSNKIYSTLNIWKWKIDTSTNTVWMPLPKSSFESS